MLIVLVSIKHVYYYIHMIFNAITTEEVLSQFQHAILTGIQVT